MAERGAVCVLAMSVLAYIVAALIFTLFAALTVLATSFIDYIIVAALVSGLFVALTTPE